MGIMKLLGKRGKGMTYTGLVIVTRKDGRAGYDLPPIDTCESCEYYDEIDGCEFE